MPDHVYELAPGARSAARALFAAATFDRVYMDAVFEGKQIGRLFVDDPVHPTGALLCRSFDYFAAGEPAPALRQFIADAPREAGVFDTLGALSDARLAPTIAFYGFVPLNDRWANALRDIHPALETIDRRAFRYGDDGGAPGSAAWHAPEGFTLHAIDAALALRIDVELDELIALFWGDYATFATYGFGACAMAGDELASVAYAVTVSDTETNIGVATVEAFQRRGLGAAVCRATIAQALERGLTPTWDCDLVNPRSARLAQRLGFIEQPPFVELGFPDRIGPDRTSGIWSSAPARSGLIWSR